MALGEDEVVVARVVRVVEVVAEVLREQHRHQVGRRTSTRSDGPTSGPQPRRIGVDAQLLAELAPEFRAFHAR